MDEITTSSPAFAKPTVSRSNGFKQRFLFPNEVFTFGKYKGKPILEVVKSDKIYFDWLIKEGLSVTKLITDCADGINVEQEKIDFSINKKDDILIIRSVKFYFLPKEKFIRGKDKKKQISNTIINTYKIKIPFNIRTEHHSEYRDYTKFHNDGELIEWETKVKDYEQPTLNNFINECLKLNGGSCFC